MIAVLPAFWREPIESLCHGLAKKDADDDLLSHLRAGLATKKVKSIQILLADGARGAMTAIGGLPAGRLARVPSRGPAGSRGQPVLSEPGGSQN